MATYLTTQCKDTNNEKQIKALYYTYFQVCRYQCILSMNLTDQHSEYELWLWRQIT